jgi:hypothetical protein
MTETRFKVGQRVTIEYEIVSVSGTEGDPWYELQRVNDYSTYEDMSERELLDVADYPFAAPPSENPSVRVPETL